MRKALIVGIDHYSRIPSLNGCVKDAYSISSVLERNSDGSVNFHCNLQTCSKENEAINRRHLRGLVQDLFSGDSDIALLYFSGHGYVDTIRGVLCTTDSVPDDEGLSLSDVINIANNSGARNKVIILDCCHSGSIGDSDQNKNISEISYGTTILTASTKDQYALEDEEGGIFTNLLVDALEGAAADILGQITPGSVYSHIDQSLGWWSQRPVFKTNVQTFVSLRTVDAAISLTDIRRITELFPYPGFEFPLDPSFEPEREEGAEKKDGYIAPDPKNTAVFRVLQKYNRVNLLKPVGVEHMWHAAMESKTCKLTALGEHYRRLVAKRLI